MILILFVFISLGLLYARAAGLFGRRTDIPPKIEWRLDLQTKLAVQRINLAAVAAFIFLARIAQQLPLFFAFAALIIGVFSLLLPMRYGLSEEGVMFNGRLLRFWNEFDSFELKGRRLTLRGRNRFNFLHIYLPARNRKEEAIVKFARSRLRKNKI